MNKEIERLSKLLGTHGYLGLSTCDADGKPWACNLNYVVEDFNRGSLVYYSTRDSNHSTHIGLNNHVAGTIYCLEPNLDGLQFTGEVEEIHVNLERIHETYYRTNFPDPEERQNWEIPKTSFSGDSKHRFYRITFKQVWLIDTTNWEIDKVDRRSEIDLNLLSQ